MNRWLCNCVLPLFSFVAIALVTRCANYENHNPAMAFYHGDYRLKVAWANLPVPLSTNTEYRAACTTGADTFSAFRVPDSLAQFVDTLRLSRSPHDTIVLYFAKEFHGTLVVRGIRPNRDEVRDSARIDVVNPLRPTVSAPGSANVGTGVNYLAVALATPAGSTARVYWTIKNSFRVDSIVSPVASCTLSAAVTVVSSFGPDTLCLWARNSRGYASDTAKVTLIIRGVVPSIDSLWTKDSLRCGDTLRFYVAAGGYLASKFSVCVASSPAPYADTSALYGFPSAGWVTMKKALIDTLPQTLVVTLRDSSGVLSQLVKKTVTMIFVPVGARFLKDTLIVSLGDTTLVSLVDSVPGSVRYVWRFGAAAPETTTAGSLQKVFGDTTPIRATVFGVDRFGYRGTPDTTVIIARPFDYKLAGKQDSFPDTVIARHPATWSVVLDNPAKLAARGGRYYWHATIGSRVVDTSGPVLSSLGFTIMDSVPVVLSVQVKDTIQGSSAVLLQPVTVRLFRPYLAFVKRLDTTRINNQLIVRVTRHDTNPGGRVDSIYWDIGANGTVDSVKSDSSIVLSFNQPSTVKVAAWAKDNDGFLSPPDTETILVKADYPYFGNRPDTATYINVPCMLRDPALPGASGVPIVQYYWYVVNDNVRDSTTGDSLSYTFRTATSYTIVVSCRDAGNVTSAPDTFHVTVDQGRPYFSAVSLQPGADSLFVVSPIRFTLAANDPNGSVDSFKVSWHGDTIFAEAVKALSQAAIFSHTFASGESGGTVVRFRAVGNDGLIRDTLFNVFVRRGAPVVSTLKPDTVWVSDDTTFSVAAFDTSGTVDSLIVDWGDGTQAQHLQSSARLHHLFAPLHYGLITARIVAVDNRGIASDTLKAQLLVRRGAPVVDSLLPHIVWVNDDTGFSVFARDTNGTVDSISINWGDGSPLSLFVKGAAISHKFSVTAYGRDTVRVAVRDNDGIWSDTLRSPLLVRLGAPALWGDSKDTVWVVIDKGYGVTYNVHINSTDTNGTIGRYYWSEAQTFDSTGAVKTVDSLYPRLIGVNDVNKSFPVWIYGRDDDGLMGGGQFTAFADSAPPAPVFTYDKTAGQVRIGWIGKDTKDQNATMFEILLKRGSAPAGTDTLIGFTSGTMLNPGLNGYDFSYIFAPAGGNGTYYYQVIAKDARGSMSSNSASFFNFP